MYCKNCGAQIADDAGNCSKCGLEMKPVNKDEPILKPSTETAQLKTDSSIGTGALYTAIVGIVLCWVPIIGLVLSLIAIGLCGKDGTKRTSKQIAGLIVGIIGAAIGVIVLIIMIASVAMGDGYSSLFYY